MSSEDEIKTFERFKDCSFTERATTFPFAQRWICDHCGTELNYRPFTIKESFEILHSNQSPEHEF